MITVPNASLTPVSSSFDPSSSQNAPLLTQLNQQTETPQDAASLLKKLAEEDPAYNELYIQLLAERENQERAYQWYEDFNNSYFQRTTRDLEAAGLNPWLALQSLGSSGSGSVSPAGSWSGTSGSTLSAKMKEADRELGKQALSSSLSVMAAIAGALIIALL